MEDVIVWFNEVCLDSEIYHSGDPSVVQKWTEPIRYSVEGDPTPEDLTVLDGLNKLERFWCNMSRVPEKMQQKFISAHPDTLIMFDGTRSTDDGWRDHPRYTQYRDMFENFAWRPFE